MAEGIADGGGGEAPTKEKSESESMIQVIDGRMIEHGLQIVDALLYTVMMVDLALRRWSVFYVAGDFRDSPNGFSGRKSKHGPLSLTHGPGCLSQNCSSSKDCNPGQDYTCEWLPIAPASA